MKKIWWALIVLLVAILAVAIIWLMSLNPSGPTGNRSVSSGPSGDKVVGLGSASDRFIGFSAELSCAMYEYSQLEDNDEARGNRSDRVDPLLKKYGFSEQDVETLSQEYKDDIGFSKAVLEKMKTLCPDAAPGLEQNIEIMEKGFFIEVNVYEAENRAEINYKFYNNDGGISEGERSCDPDINSIHEAIRQIFPDELEEKVIANLSIG